eukprot:1135196-Rhodomonas_salina.10
MCGAEIACAASWSSRPTSATCARASGLSSGSTCPSAGSSSATEHVPQQIQTSRYSDSVAGAEDCCRHQVMLALLPFMTVMLTKMGAQRKIWSNSLGGQPPPPLSCCGFVTRTDIGYGPSGCRDRREEFRAAGAVP